MPKQSHYLAMIDAQIRDAELKLQASQLNTNALAGNVKQLQELRTLMSAGAKPRRKKTADTKQAELPGGAVLSGER